MDLLDFRPWWELCLQKFCSWSRLQGFKILSRLFLLDSAWTHVFSRNLWSEINIFWIELLLVNIIGQDHLTYFTFEISLQTSWLLSRSLFLSLFTCFLILRSIYKWDAGFSNINRSNLRGLHLKKVQIFLSSLCICFHFYFYLQKLSKNI